jgi:colanic acid/amylovoran biosynthesis glycosyltransferase
MNHSLLLAPSLTAGIARQGVIRLTAKFISGMRAYVDLWGEPVTALIEPDQHGNSGNLDDVWIRPDELPFQTVVTRFDSELARKTMMDAGVVLGGPDPRMNHAATTCASAGVPFVMVTEYSLKTRLQIVDADRPVFWRRWRRRQWEIGQERATIASIRKAAGLQCNGTPTFEAYREMNPNTLLYFDNRVSKEMIATEPALASRNLVFSAQRPLRLAFSGRLSPMKGADHLVRVAASLRQQGVPFRFDIYGDGPLAQSMAEEIRSQGLEKEVVLGGVLDFATELVPRMRQDIDLFVCCHRQGDPSCTYLETWACGIPIVGYDNEAFAGLLRICRAGLAVRTDDWRGLAQAIARLSQAPGELIDLAREGVSFARRHTFESEFQARINHAKQLLDQRTQ